MCRCTPLGIDRVQPAPKVPPERLLPRRPQPEWDNGQVVSSIDVVHMPDTLLRLVPRRGLWRVERLVPTSSAIVERVRVVPALRLAVEQRSRLGSRRGGMS